MSRLEKSLLFTVENHHGDNPVNVIDYHRVRVFSSLKKIKNQTGTNVFLVLVLTSVKVEKYTYKQIKTKQFALLLSKVHLRDGHTTDTYERSGRNRHRTSRRCVLLVYVRVCARASVYVCVCVRARVNVYKQNGTAPQSVE